MTSDKMLIDAAHPEETRVVVLRGNRIEEFDYESAAKKLLRGNIYLAKITRVEPSLQAAFVDYGGNRHGFLAFSEIHPDYYQIPVADRQALLREEAEAARAEARREAADVNGGGERAPAVEESESGAPTGEIEEAGGGSVPWDIDEPDSMPPVDSSPLELPVESLAADRAEDALRSDIVTDAQPGAVDELAPYAPPLPADVLETDRAVEVDGNGGPDALDTGLEVEVVATAADAVVDEAVEEVVERRRAPRRAQYRIQEVIKRRQILLVQVVKEERGNKGAALTTYLSLAGRYTVLMPNTARGGGISRKITNGVDRKRLKEITSELEVPEGMGLIVRTAGASRTKAEIKRDFEYLLRLWDSVRELTLRSSAPALVYEEGSLVKRSIRDLYSKEIEEVLVAGDEAYSSAREFMRMLMPSHAKNVKLYGEAEPLFARYQIERQLNAMYSPYVTLRSGGYVVINQTEALVAIDVNSGKATREHSIEETALNTNLEAADEISRQLRLRDLAGLIVIDFIDMEERRNNRAVERRLKEALRFDRARIQVGRISHFGLMEMSRQRLRTGVLEGSTSQCPHCLGTGLIRSTESVALAVLRAIEDALMAGPPRNLMATTSIEAALYLLNEKRSYLRDIEARYGITIEVDANAELQGANFKIEATGGQVGVPQRPAPRHAVQLEAGFDGEEAEAEAEAAAADEGEEEPVEERSEERAEGEQRRSRRRRRRRGERGERTEIEIGAGSNGNGNGSNGRQLDAEAAEPAGNVEEVPADEAEDGDEGDVAEGARAEAGTEDGERSERRGRRRGRRGGRRNRRGERPSQDAAGQEAIPGTGEQPSVWAEGAEQTEVAPGIDREGTRSEREDRVGAAAGFEPEAGREPDRIVPLEPAPFVHVQPPEHALEPHRIAEAAEAVGSAFQSEPAAPMAAAAESNGNGASPEPDTVMAEPVPADTSPPRKGWWTRRFSGGR